MYRRTSTPHGCYLRDSQKARTVQVRAFSVFPARQPTAVTCGNGDGGNGGGADAVFLADAAYSVVSFSFVLRLPILLCAKVSCPAQVNIKFFKLDHIFGNLSSCVLLAIYLFSNHPLL